MSHSNQLQPSASEATFPLLSESAAALLSTPVPSTAFAASPFGQSMPMFAPSSPFAPLTSTNAGGPFVLGGALPISSSSGIAAAAASPFGQSMPIFPPPSAIAPLTSTNAGGPFVFVSAVPISSSGGVAAVIALVSH